MKKMNHTIIIKKIVAISLAALMVGGTTITSLPVIHGSDGSIVKAAEVYENFEYDLNDDGSITITKYSGSDTELIIPSEISEAIVTKIAPYAFANNTTLQSVILSDTIIDISEYAFANCSELNNVIIGSSVETIGARAFIDCPNLKSITIPNNVKFIDDTAFSCYILDDEGNIEQDLDFIIYGETGSAAEEYAKENGFIFVDLSIIEAETITLDKTSVTLNKGQSVTLKATITPENTTDQTVIWNSSNEKVAAVSNGIVNAIGVGTANITAETANGKKVVCKVTVKSPATKISLNKTSATLEKGKTLTLKATITPTDSTDNVTWSSTDTSIASVSKGKVTAKKAGTVTITAKTTSGQKASCKITVKPPVSSVKLNKTSATVQKGKSITLKATINPSNAINKTVTWTTSNKNIATVSGGKVTTKKAGTVTITAKTANGKKATCKITVKPPATGIKLNKTKATIGKGETLILKATVSPSNAINKTVTWTTSNKKIATVKNGKVTAKKTGTVTITAKTVNGKKTTCKITVKKAPSSIKLNKTKLTIYTGKTNKLTSSVNKGAASSKRIYSSSNTKVCTVDSTGKITAKKAGTATITVKTYNGKKAVCKVTVKNGKKKITKIAGIPTGTTTTTGGKFGIGIEVYPKNANISNLKVTVNNKAIKYTGIKKDSYQSSNSCDEYTISFTATQQSQDTNVVYTITSGDISVKGKILVRAKKDARYAAYYTPYNPDQIVKDMRAYGEKLGAKWEDSFYIHFDKNGDVKYLKNAYDCNAAFYFPTSTEHSLDGLSLYEDFIEQQFDVIYKRILVPEGGTWKDLRFKIVYSYCGYSETFKKELYDFYVLYG